MNENELDNLVLDDSLEAEAMLVADPAAPATVETLDAIDKVLTSGK